MRAREARSSAWARSFAIACAARSAKLRSLTSAPAGKGSSAGRDAVRAPSNAAFTIIGAEMVEQPPSCSGGLSERLAKPVSRTRIVALSWAGGGRGAGLHRGRVCRPPAADDHHLVLNAFPADEHHPRRAEQLADVGRHL